MISIDLKKFEQLFKREAKIDSANFGEWHCYNIMYRTLKYFTKTTNQKLIDQIINKYDLKTKSHFWSNELLEEKFIKESK